MNVKLSLLVLLIAGQCMIGKTYAQHNLTIVYDITVNKTKNSSGIEETYNGGTKAVFISHTKARIRLVSLMRIESIFFDYDSTLKTATVIKESGAKKYSFDLTADNWKDYNSKYENVTCDLQNDSLDIAGYHCKKAIINLSSGDKIDVYYTDSIKTNNSFIEPAFSCIPGTVLQYEVTSKRGVVSCKASQVSREAIAKDVFTIPTAGVEKRKYSPAKKDDE